MTALLPNQQTSVVLFRYFPLQRTAVSEGKSHPPETKGEQRTSKAISRGTSSCAIPHSKKGNSYGSRCPSCG